MRQPPGTTAPKFAQPHMNSTRLAVCATAVANSFLQLVFTCNTNFFFDNVIMGLPLACARKNVPIMFDTQCHNRQALQHSPCVLCCCLLYQHSATPTPLSSPTAQVPQRCINVIKLSGLLNSTGYLHQPFFHHSYKQCETTQHVNSFKLLHSELNQIE